MIPPRARPFQSKTTLELAEIAERLRKLRVQVDYQILELVEEMRVRQEIVDQHAAERQALRDSRERSR